MRPILGLLALAVRCCWGADSEVRANPIGKTVELLSKLEASIRQDGDTEQEAYREYFQWCDDAAHEKKNEIKAATKETAKLEAEIQKRSGEIETASVRVDELSKQLASTEAGLQDAGEIRGAEAAVFKESDAKLMEAIDMLGRATDLVKKEMSGGGATSFMQAKAGLGGVLFGLEAVIDAAGLPSEDSRRLAALIQRRQGEDGDDELGAPDAEAYTSHSGNIVEVMEDLRDKAEAQLRDGRKAEANSQQNHGLLRASLESQKANAEKERLQAKAAKAESAEVKALAEKDLAMAKGELTQSSGALQSIQTGCMQKAADHEESLKGREAELGLLAKARGILQSTTGGAAGRAYALVQVASSSKGRRAAGSRAQLAGREAVDVVRRLAKERRSASLAQLASRLTAALRYGAAAGQDPFGKVKALIEDMVRRLESEANADQTEKAYCDSELAKTAARQEELEDETGGLHGKIDQAAAASAALKGQVKDLQGELSDLAKLQAERQAARADSNKAYLASRADLQQGLDGVRSAMRLLRDYYSAAEGGEALLQGSLAAEMRQPAAPAMHSKASSAGASIIGLLEVAESDIAKNLAEEETEEDTAAAGFEKLTQENNVARALKEKDVEYKTREFKGLDKSITDLSADYDTAGQELAAVEEYLSKLKDRCIAKAEPYAERKARREAEIRGLQEALALLEGEGSFLQRRRR